MSIELLFAASRGDIAKVQQLLREEAPINPLSALMRTAVSSAIKGGDNSMVKCLIKEGGADINTMITVGNERKLTELLSDIKQLLTGNYKLIQTCTMLSWAAGHGNYPLVQWLIEEGALVPICIWEYLGKVVEHADAAELSSMLKVLLLLPMSPEQDLPAFVAKLSPQHAELCRRGRQLRDRLPAYLEQQEASVGTHCTLPAVLVAMVTAYALHTPEELWSDGLQWLDSADLDDKAG
jgi:hypothetical protein